MVDYDDDGLPILRSEMDRITVRFTPNCDEWPREQIEEYIRKCYKNITTFDQLAIADICCTRLLRYVADDDVDFTLDLASTLTDEARYKITY